MSLQTRRAGSPGQPSSGEISAFKARLRALPLETLREKLIGPALGKRWQRELAEDEMDERESEVDDTPSEGEPAARRRGIPAWGWLVSLTLIGVSTAIVVYAAYLVWEM